MRKYEFRYLINDYHTIVWGEIEAEENASDEELEALARKEALRIMREEPGRVLGNKIPSIRPV